MDRESLQFKSILFGHTIEAGDVYEIVAALQPPSLKAIMMVEVVDNLYLHNYPGGVFVNRSFMYTDFCPANNAISTSERIYLKEVLADMVTKRLEDPDISNSALYMGILKCQPPKNQTYFFDVLLLDDDSEFLQEKSIGKYVDKIKIPMYLISEYYELGRFSQGPFFVYNNANQSVPRKLFAPEEHDDLHLPHRILTAEYVRWYDYWLKGINNGIMD